MNLPRNRREAMEAVYGPFPQQQVSWRTSDGKSFSDYDVAYSHQREIDFQPVIDKAKKEIADCFKNAPKTHEEHQD